MKMENRIVVGLMNLDKIALAELEKSHLLSKQVFNQVSMLNGKRKMEFVVGRFLLASLLQQHFGINHLPEIKIIANTKPVFVDNALPDFNISHSGNCIAVAVCDQGAIGLDIEKQRPRKNMAKIAYHFFSEEEHQWLHNQEDSLSAFWQLWTLREAALKLHAKGVWQMRQLKIDPKLKRISSTFAHNFYYDYRQIGSVHLSICGRSPITQLDIEIR